MSYQIYRNSTLGISLQDTLDEMIKKKQITPQIAITILKEYDKVINKVRNNNKFCNLELNVYLKIS